MKKILTFFAAALMSVSLFAAKDVVPSDEYLRGLYNDGDVCVCIYVDAANACNDIVLTGSFNNWSTNASDCPQFKSIEGYDGWYIASFESEDEPDAEKGMQAMPIMKDSKGNISRDYQAGVVELIRGGVTVLQGAAAGEIELNQYGADAPNVFRVDSWKNDPCVTPTAPVITISAEEIAFGEIAFEDAPKGKTLSIDASVDQEAVLAVAVEGAQKDNFVAELKEGKLEVTFKVDPAVAGDYAATAVLSAEGAENKEVALSAKVKAAAPVADDNVAFGFEEFEGQGVSSTGGEVKGEKNGVSFHCNKAFGAEESIRCYSGGTITITSADKQIGKIEFVFGKVSGQVKDGGLSSTVVVNAKEWKETLGSQARIVKFTVFFGEAEAPEIKVITVAEALEIGGKLAKDAKSEEKYIIDGFVIQIDDNSFNTDYKNMVFWIADHHSTAASNAAGALKIYRGKPDVELVPGDKVRVEGKLYNYKGSEVQCDQGAKVTRLRKNGLENVVLTEKAQKVLLDGAVYIIRDNKMYNLQGARVR